MHRDAFSGMTYHHGRVSLISFWVHPVRFSSPLLTKWQRCHLLCCQCCRLLSGVGPCTPRVHYDSVQHDLSEICHNGHHTPQLILSRASSHSSPLIPDGRLLIPPHWSIQMLLYHSINHSAPATANTLYTANDERASILTPPSWYVVSMAASIQWSPFSWNRVYSSRPSSHFRGAISHPSRLSAMGLLFHWRFICHLGPNGMIDVI